MIFESIVLFAAGFVSSIYGAISGGAAILTVPVLVFMGLAPAAAVATNRLVIFFQGLARIPFVYGKLDIGFKIPFIIIVSHTIGAAAGAYVLVSAEESFSFFILGIILIFGAILTWFSPKGIEKKEKKHITTNSLLISSVLMIVIGIYRGFFGPAAGTLSRFVFIHFLGLNFTQTLALTSYSTFVASAVALVIFLNSSLVNFSLGLPLLVGGIFGVVLGTRFVLEKGNQFMKISFIALSLIFGIYFIIRGG